MTDAQIRALKAGDRVRLHAPNKPAVERTITNIKFRDQGRTPGTQGHYWVIIEFVPNEGERHDSVAVESDEYIVGIGLGVMSPNGFRQWGAELLSTKEELTASAYAGYYGAGRGLKP